MTSDVNSFKETLQVLITSCGDRDESVNNAVVKSLTRVAAVYPNELIEYFCNFYKENAKVNLVLLGNMIKVLEQTCVNHMKQITTDSAKILVEAMLRAMTQNTDYQPAVQMGASSVLVAIGHLQLDLVLQTLIKEIPKSSMPHYTIPHTLGTLAAVNTQIVVPFVKDILAKMLPLLALVKVDGTKQAFAYAFGHFAVAVSEYIGDNVENDTITSIKENFVVEFSIIFDVLYNQWLHSGEPKVSESVLEALGPLTRLISERKFDETVNKVILSLLSLYRKSSINPYYVSQCISYILSQSPLNPKLTLNENVISSTNHTLFNLIILEPDYDQPHTVKNHFEVLRCFDHLCGQFPEPTIEGLLNQCKNNQEKDRMKAVIILTHLTTSSQVFIEKYAVKFISLLKVMCNMEQGWKMKKLIAKAIVGLVYRNCVTSAEDFTMVEFIIKHCGFDLTAPPSPDIVDLQETCKSSLVLLCNSATNVKGQLRDLLLKSLTVEEFTSSMATVSHCLCSLLQNDSNLANEERPDSVSEYKVSSDLVFIRCVTHLADPEQVDRNKNILLFLDEYAGDVHRNLKASWTVEVERLLKFVMKNESEDQWHSMLLDLLISAIDQVNSNKWIENVSTMLSHQILKTKQPPIIKGISLQFLAILSCHMSNAAVVEQVLKIILIALKSIPIESVDYVSKAIGIASRQHGEYILNELDAFYKEIEGKRGSKLLNLLSSRHSRIEAEMNASKYAVIVCYGKVACECLDVHVLARLGENVTVILFDILKTHPGKDLCRASISTLYEISRALQPAAHHNVVLRNRWQLLNAVLEQIYNPNLDKKNVELYPIIVKASMGLTKLQKGILPEERNTILRNLFSNIFGELSSFKMKYEVEGNGEENDLLAKTLNDSLTLLHDLIRELVIQSTCLSTLDDLVGLLHEWLTSDNDEIRTAAVLIFQVIFDVYIKNVKLNYETPGKFGQLGYLLGLILPGIADSVFPVRLTTIDCIKVLIQIQYLYEGHTIEPDDKVLNALSSLQNNVLTNDLDMIKSYCKEVSETICEKLPPHYTMQFVESLLESYDDDLIKGTGVSAILNALFLKKGQDLFQNIERIMQVILETMEQASPEASERLIQPVMSLARHHSNAVTAVLLAQSIPFRQCVVLCWRNLAKDESLSTAVVENFLRLLNSVELYEDPYHITERRIAALQPLTLISALGEMLTSETMSNICVNMFPEMFTMLYSVVACYMNAEPPAYSVPPTRGQERLGYIPNRQAIKLSPGYISFETFKNFLERANLPKVREACSLLSLVETGGASRLARALAEPLVRPLVGSLVSPLARLVTTLGSAARAPRPPQRAAALALMASLLPNLSDPVQTDAVVASLTLGCTDTTPLVRSAALRSLASLGTSHARRAALAALSQGVDGPPHRSTEENVPLAAMQGLNGLLAEVDKFEPECDRELLAISQKIRPFMNTECAMLREYSIRLFGIICSKVKSEHLVEQSIASLPCFLLHLCDVNPAVVRASKFTLKQVFKTLNTPKTNDLVQTHLMEEGRLLLEDFVTALLRLLAKELPSSISRCLETAVNYLHGVHDSLKPYAPFLVGKLYAALYDMKESHPEEANINEEVSTSVRNRLLQLVKDQDPLVRQHSANALSYVCLLA